VLKRSDDGTVSKQAWEGFGENIPSRVMPGLRGTPAGIKMTSAPVKHSLSPDGVGSWPVTCIPLFRTSSSSCGEIVMDVLCSWC